MSFNQSMTIPLELRLVSTDDGPRMTFTPIEQLEALRTKTTNFEAMVLKPGDRNPSDDLELELLEIRTEIEPGNASEIVFNVRDAMILYETAKQEISVDGQRAAVPLLEGKLRLKIYGDRTGLEVFVSDGLCYLPIPFNTNPENRKVFLESQAGAARVRKLEVHQLRSAWVLP